MEPDILKKKPLPQTSGEFGLAPPGPLERLRRAALGIFMGLIAAAIMAAFFLA